VCASADFLLFQAFGLVECAGCPASLSEFLLTPRLSVYWFFYAIFLCFVAVALLERFLARFDGRAWLVCFALAFATSLVLAPYNQDFWGRRYNVLGYEGFFFLFPFFLFGVGMWRYRERLFTTAASVAIGVVLVAAYVALACGVVEPASSAELALERLRSIALAAGAFTLVANPIRPRLRIGVRPLVAIGRFSFSIYVLHMILIGQIPRVADRLHLAGSVVDQALVVAAVVGACVLLHHGFAQFRLTRVAILGLDGAPPPRTPP
jgi:peptidoglycan/LPS O-acetylase OafA/YrhL